MARRHRRKGYFLADFYARKALNVRDSSMSMADATAHVAVERFPYLVIPGVGASIFRLHGSDQRQLGRIRDRLFGNGRTDKVWTNLNIAKDFHSYVKAMMRQRDVHVHCVFEQEDGPGDHMLVEMAVLPAETIVRRRLTTETVFEQYVSARASEDSGYSVSGGPREYFYVFSEREMFFLRWPLAPSSGRPPVEVARRAGRALDRYADRGLKTAYAGARPDETFLTVARARAGRSINTVEEMEHLNAVIGDRLYRIPPDPMTEYFFVDRLIRSKVAAANVRAYVLHEFNRQILTRWCDLNAWDVAELQLAPCLFSAAEWRDLGNDYKAGSASLEDVLAAAEAEDEASRRFD